MPKKKTALVGRILAVLLILGSAALFLLPWVGVSLTVDGQTGGFDSFLEEASAQSGMTVEQMKDYAISEIESGLDDLYYTFGAQPDSDNVLRFARTAMKGAWSPVDLMTMLGGVKSASGQMMEALGPEMDLMSGIPEVQSLQQADQYIHVAYYIVMGLLILCAALALLAVICALAGRKGGVIPYMIAAIVMLGIFIALVVGVNRAMADSASDLSSSLGLDFSGSNGVALKLGIWGIASAGLAVLAFVVMFIRQRSGSAAKSGAGTRSSAGGWTCPNCGSVRKEDEKFCLSCGAKRPDASAPELEPGGWTCPVCSSPLKANQQFCLYCGAKRPGEVPKPVKPKPVPRPEPTDLTRGEAGSGWTCPSCGTQLNDNQKFCLNCGAKRPAQPVRREPPKEEKPKPAPVGGWTCPTCGTQLTDSQKFCLKCGTRRPDAAPQPIVQKEPAPTPVPVTPPAAGWTCPTCGTKLTDSQKFCLKCGTRRPAAPSPAPVPPPVREKPAGNPPRGGWTCPKCGNKLTDSQKFCQKCGTKRPDAPAAAPVGGWTCPSCGTKLSDAQRFCLNCGARRPEAAPAPAHEPRHSAPVGGWTCPTCGNKLTDSQKFCLKCGTKRPEAAPAHEPRHSAPEGWTCPVCGSQLSDSQKFCLNCGTRKPEPAPVAAPVFTPEPEEKAEPLFSPVVSEPVNEPSFIPEPEPAAEPEPIFAPIPAPEAEPIPEPEPEPIPEPEPEPIPEPAPAPVSRRCPNCGYLLGGDMLFCPRCGTRFAEPAPAPAPEPEPIPEPEPEPIPEPEPEPIPEPEPEPIPEPEPEPIPEPEPEPIPEAELTVEAIAAELREDPGFVGFHSAGDDDL